MPRSSDAQRKPRSAASRCHAGGRALRHRARHPGRFAEINIANGRRNPNAQTRRWTFGRDSFGEDDEVNPVIEGMLRRNDCGQVTDGAATVFVASEKAARAMPNASAWRSTTCPSSRARGHRTGPMRLQDKLDASRDAVLILPHVKATVDEACRQAALWPDDLYVSINVAPMQLRSIDVLRQITDALSRHGLTPRRMEVEITETAMVENSQQIMMILAGLRALGVRIAMDDFGTGYSSLVHLREFELDRIKIDRSFVNASHTDPGAAAVVRAIISMAREMAISTTGEGVENEDQLANLVDYGCGTAQGYLLGRPVDARIASALAGMVPDPEGEAWRAVAG